MIGRFPDEQVVGDSTQSGQGLPWARSSRAGVGSRQEPGVLAGRDGRRSNSIPSPGPSGFPRHRKSIALAMAGPSAASSSRSACGRSNGPGWLMATRFGLVVVTGSGVAVATLTDRSAWGHPEGCFTVHRRSNLGPGPPWTAGSSPGRSGCWSTGDRRKVLSVAPSPGPLGTTGKFSVLVRRGPPGKAREMLGRDRLRDCLQVQVQGCWLSASTVTNFNHSTCLIMDIMSTFPKFRNRAGRPRRRRGGGGRIRPDRRGSRCHRSFM